MTDDDVKLPEPIGYLYHDSISAESAHPWLHSTMLVNQTPLYDEPTVRRLIEEAVERERERLARDVAELHMAQTVNHQEFPRAWHDGVDAALAVILEGRCSPPAPTVALTEEQMPAPWPIRAATRIGHISELHDYAHRAIAKFCEVNGLAQPNEAGKEGSA